MKLKFTRALLICTALATTSVFAGEMVDDKFDFSEDDFIQVLYALQDDETSMEQFDVLQNDKTSMEQFDIFQDDEPFIKFFKNINDRSDEVEELQQELKRCLLESKEIQDENIKLKFKNVELFILILQNMPTDIFPGQQSSSSINTVSLHEQINSAMGTLYPEQKTVNIDQIMDETYQYLQNIHCVRSLGSKYCDQNKFSIDYFKAEYQGIVEYLKNKCESAQIVCDINKYQKKPLEDQNINFMNTLSSKNYALFAKNYRQNINQYQIKLSSLKKDRLVSLSGQQSNSSNNAVSSLKQINTATMSVYAKNGDDDDLGVDDVFSGYLMKFAEIHNNNELLNELANELVDDKTFTENFNNINTGSNELEKLIQTLTACLLESKRLQGQNIKLKSENVELFIEFIQALNPDQQSISNNNAVSLLEQINNAMSFLYPEKKTVNISQIIDEKQQLEQIIDCAASLVINYTLTLVATKSNDVTEHQVYDDYFEAEYPGIAEELKNKCESAGRVYSQNILENQELQNHNSVFKVILLDQPFISIVKNNFNNLEQEFISFIQNKFINVEQPLILSIKDSFVSLLQRGKLFLSSKNNLSPGFSGNMLNSSNESAIIQEQNQTVNRSQNTGNDEQTVKKKIVRSEGKIVKKIKTL